MENLSFWIWLIVLLLIVGIGLGAMISAYWGKGSVTVIFPEPIPEPIAAAAIPESEAAFQQGCEAYCQGRYRQATSDFSKAIQLDPQFAAAYHNRGRAVANLRRVTEALADLVKASELYLEQGKTAELAQLKQDLATLKEKK